MKRIHCKCHLFAIKNLSKLFDLGLPPVDHVIGTSFWMSSGRDFRTLFSPREEVVDTGEDGLRRSPAISLLGDSLRPLSQTSSLVFFGEGSTSFANSSSSVWSPVMKLDFGDDSMLLFERFMQDDSLESLLSWFMLIGEPRFTSDSPSSELIFSKDWTATCLRRKDVILLPEDFSSNFVKAAKCYSKNFYYRFIN